VSGIRKATADSGRESCLLAVHLILQRPDDERVLLGLRKGAVWGSGRWHVPSGHVEAGEDAVQALVREAREELGVRIDPADLEHAVTVHHREADGEPRMQLFFAASRWSGGPVNAEPGKCEKLGWFTVDDLPSATVGYTRTALSSWNAGRSFAVCWRDSRRVDRGLGSRLIAGLQAI
jgi:8-oxo-dGTP diphosphatase